MNDLQKLIVAVLAGRARRAKAVRGRRAPACECLETRQLLNANMARDLLASPMGLLGGAGLAPIGNVPGQVHPFDRGARSTGSGARLTLSAQAQADMNALQNDTQKFEAEIPASLTATLKTDQAVIQQALTSLPRPTSRGQRGTPPQFDKLANFDPATANPTSFDPTAGLKALLTRANVPSSQIDSIVNDLKNAKTTLDSLDPALQSKIASDRAALEKDMPAHGRFDHAAGTSGWTTTTAGTTA